MYDQSTMMFADRELAKRLEAAEALCLRAVRRGAQAAVSRKHVGVDEVRGSDRGLRWSRCADDADLRAGACSKKLTPAALDEIEQFFLDRGAEVMHEVCPFAGAATLDLLCARGYRPFEISNVMYRAVEKPAEIRCQRTFGCALSSRMKRSSGATSVRGDGRTSIPNLRTLCASMGVMWWRAKEAHAFLPRSMACRVLPER